MNTKFYLAGLAGGVANFFLGWLVWGILLMSYFEANTKHYDGLFKEMPDWTPLILSNLVAGFFLAFIFKHWASISTFKGGMTGGLIIGAFIATMFDLSFLSMWNLYSIPATIVDILAAIVVTAIVGGIVGWVLGYDKPAKA